MLAVTEAGKENTDAVIIMAVARVESFMVGWLRRLCRGSTRRCKRLITKVLSIVLFDDVEMKGWQILASPEPVKVSAT